MTEEDRKRFAPLFTTPIEEYIENTMPIEMERYNRRNRTSTRGTDPEEVERNRNIPLGDLGLPQEWYNGSESDDQDNDRPLLDAFDKEMVLINKVAPEAEGLSQEEQETLGDLMNQAGRYKKRSQGRVLGTAAQAGNPFAMDTRGASYAVSNVGASRRNQMRDQKLGEIAPELNQLSTKQEQAKEANERRQDLIDERAMKTADRVHEKRKEDDEAELQLDEKYYQAGLRLLSQGETEQAEEYLKKAGLSVDEIDEEIHSRERDKTEAGDPETDEETPSAEIETSEIENSNEVESSEQELTNDQDKPTDKEEAPLIIRHLDDPGYNSPFSLKDLGRRFSTWIDEFKERLSNGEGPQDKSEEDVESNKNHKPDLDTNKKLDDLFDKLLERADPEMQRIINDARMEIQDTKK